MQTDDNVIRGSQVCAVRQNAEITCRAESILKETQLALVGCELKCIWNELH